MNDIENIRNIFFQTVITHLALFGYHVTVEELFSEWFYARYLQTYLEGMRKRPTIQEDEIISFVIDDLLDQLGIIIPNNPKSLIE
jgi:hypothetical protein